MKIQKILAGIDFGAATNSVMAYTSTFAAALHASVHLLHVLDYVVTPPAYLAPYINEEKKIAEGNFTFLKKQLGSAGIVTTSETVIGRLQDSFASSLKKSHADMLVLGFMTHPFRRSSSEKLIKGLQLPMLVVRGAKAGAVQDGMPTIRKILCATDFSAHSLKALHTAKELCAVFSARLDVLHVAPVAIIEQMKATDEREKALRELIENATVNLERALSEHGLTGAGTVDKGEPDRQIVAFAERHDTDLIVTGARGLGLLEGMFIGSVTDAVLKSSPCPVIVVH